MNIVQRFDSAGAKAAGSERLVLRVHCASGAFNNSQCIRFDSQQAMSAGLQCSCLGARLMYCSNAPEHRELRSWQKIIRYVHGTNFNSNLRFKITTFEPLVLPLHFFIAARQTGEKQSLHKTFTLYPSFGRFIRSSSG